MYAYGQWSAPQSFDCFFHSILQVCEEQNCEEQVFPLAVNFMDRFLCECAIPRQQLQLVGATALLVSTKIRQCHNLTIHLLCAYTDHSVAPEEIKVSLSLVISNYYSLLLKQSALCIKANHNCMKEKKDYIKLSKNIRYLF